MAKANPFRFSTKYQDDETDLLLSPGGMKPATDGHFKTGHSEVRSSYHFCLSDQAVSITS